MAKRIFSILFLLSIAVFVKLVVIDIYRIPSGSMENELYPGDVVAVNKLKYGPRLPQSPFEIPFVNLVFYMNKHARSRFKEIWWDYHRWNGTTEIKQGDIFVFNSTWDKNYIMIKRCVGLPGDSLAIKKGEIYTNSTIFCSHETVKENWSFRIRDKKKLYQIMDSLPIDGYLDCDCKKRNLGNAVLSKQELELLVRRKAIDSVCKIIDAYGDMERPLLKNSSASNWTLDDMGPIIVPKKGMVIKLNPKNLMLYRSIICNIEKCRLSENDGAYFINGKKAQTYKFMCNYYFMMGDNRKSTMDSRVWGFLPESNIVGKVQCVLFSNKNREFQWNRFFKMI